MPEREYRWSGTILVSGQPELDDDEKHVHSIAGITTWSHRDRDPARASVWYTNEIEVLDADESERPLGKDVQNRLPLDFMVRGDLVVYDGMGTNADWSGNYRNEGMWVYDGRRVVSLEHDLDEYGYVPREFRTFEEFPIHYFWDIAHGSKHHVDIDDARDELIKNAAVVASYVVTHAVVFGHVFRMAVALGSVARNASLAVFRGFIADCGNVLTLDAVHDTDWLFVFSLENHYDEPFLVFEPGLSYMLAGTGTGDIRSSYDVEI